MKWLWMIIFKFIAHFLFSDFSYGYSISTRHRCKAFICSILWMISSKTHITNPFITLWHYHTILYKKNEIKLQFLPLHITASFLVFLYENHILDSRISRSSIPMPIPRKAIGWGLFSFVLIIEVAGADGPDGRNIIYRFSFRTRIKFFF